VPCLFVRDAEPVDPQRHRARVSGLVARKRITQAQADAAFAEAARRGISAGEALLLARAIDLDDWAPRKGSCLAALLAGLLTLMAGCHSFAIPPLYEQDLDPAPMREGERRVEWDFDIGLRPLFQARATEDRQRLEAHLLFPLGMMERGPTQRQVRLYPIYQSLQRTDPDGFQDEDTIVFPFVFTGTHPVEGSYLYVFPFGGTLRGLLGKDEAAGVLFPIYGWTRDRDTETHHVLWPLISWTHGGGATGFRVLPFYGHQEKVNEAGEVVFDRTTVMWPFIHFAHDGTNSRNRFDSVVVFPFFGRTRSPWMDDDAILWPLFRWFHDKQTGYREWRLPFPFLIVGSGGDQTRFDLWPLYGQRHRGDFRRHFALWPIGRREVQDTEAWTDSRLWVLPLFWTMNRTWKDGSGEDVRTSLFPLLRYVRRRDGAFEVRALAPLWFEDPMENFDTILDPLWRLFRYARDAEGRTALDLLFGLYSSRTTQADEERSRWDLLGGLVGHSTMADGSGKTRLLWVIEW
jgi:hypothetical protein